MDFIKKIFLASSFVDIRSGLVSDGENGVHWVQKYNGHVPEDAVRDGRTPDGEFCYIGRVYIDWRTGYVMGQVIPSRRCLVVIIDGQERTFPNYEVMVRN